MRTCAHRGLASVIAGIALSYAATGARADFSYAFSRLYVSGINVTGQGMVQLGGTVTGSITSASATRAGSGVSTNDPTDTPQAYLGASPVAPEDYSYKYSTQGGGTQGGDFARGDVVLQNLNLLFGPLGNGVTVDTVAEAAGSTPLLETGTANWQLSGTFTTIGTNVTVSYGVNDDALAQTSGTSTGPAEANFSLLVTIKDQHGHIAQDTFPPANVATSSPTNGPEIINSYGYSSAIPLTGLTAGDVFTITIAGETFASVGTTVPEPASLSVFGGALLLLVKRRR